MHLDYTSWKLTAVIYHLTTAGYGRAGWAYGWSAAGRSAQLPRGMAAGLHHRLSASFSMEIPTVRQGHHTRSALNVSHTVVWIQIQIHWIWIRIHDFRPNWDPDPWLHYQFLRENLKNALEEKTFKSSFWKTSPGEIFSQPYNFCLFFNPISYLVNTDPIWIWIHNTGQWSHMDVLQHNREDLHFQVVAHGQNTRF